MNNAKMLYKLKQDYIRLANADNLCTALKTKSFKSCLLLLNFEIAVNIWAALKIKSHLSHAF